MTRTAGKVHLKTRVLKVLPQAYYFSFLVVLTTSFGANEVTLHMSYYDVHGVLSLPLALSVRVSTCMPRL